MFNQKEYAKQYYLKTRELQIERAKQWQKDNPEKAKKYRSERYWNNPEKFRKTLREYAIKNKESLNVKARKSSCYFHLKRRLFWINERCGNPKQKMYKYYGGKGIKNYLTIESLKSLWDRDNASQFNYPTIDRINSSKSYTIDNCRFVEKKLNDFLGRESKMIPIRKSIQIIKRLKKLGINAPTLAKITGISKNEFYKWFKGKCHISKKSYGKLIEKGVIT